MDQFELARLKTAKREAKRGQIAELAEHLAPSIEESFAPSIHEIPKEKPKRTQDGVFTIAVDLPHMKFAFVLTKQSILSHTTISRLTASEIRKHICQGLKPLLGELE